MKLKLQRGLLISFIISIAACALIGVLVLLLEFGSTGERVLVSCITVAGLSLLGMFIAPSLRMGQLRLVGRTGIGICALTLVMTMMTIWEMWDWLFPRPSGFFIFSDGDRWTAVAWVWSCFLAHFCLLAMARLNRSAQTLRTVARICALIVAVTMTYLIFDGNVSRYVERWLGAVAVVGVGLSLMMPLFHDLHRIKQVAELVTTTIDLQITCPRCSLAQTLQCGPSKCSGCGLGFRIEIVEERCAKCGYLLYQLESPNCPECGTAVLGAGIAV